MHDQKENFKPIKNDPPINFVSKTKFLFRLLFDFQTMTLYRDLKKFLHDKEGTILDIGCGNCPYEHLANDRCKYIGIDIENQSDFDYHNKKIISFNGSVIPMGNQTVDSFICTEVLEHVMSPDKLISEMKRVLKKNGQGLLSIPWSARYHYIPFDYYRYTPSALEILFQDFKVVRIDPRGSDTSVICSKLIVSIVRALRGCRGLYLIFMPLLIMITIPIIIICLIVGHASIILNLGSKNDPLGYTIYLTK